MSRISKDAEDNKQKHHSNRRRSVPYGVDFDLDEVWSPKNPHLKHIKKTSENKSKTKGKSHQNGISQVFNDNILHIKSK